MEHDGSRTAALVRAAAGGDAGAFAELVEQHVELVRAVCGRWLDDRGAVDDVVQDAVVTAMTSLDRLRHPASFGSWLVGIALNTARRHVAQRRRAPLPLDALLGGRQLPEPADPDPGPAERAQAGDDARRLARAVAALPPGQAAAVVAYYLRGLTVEETARHLGVSVTAVKNRLHKGRAALRADLRPDPSTGPRTEEPEESTVTAPVRVRPTAVRRLDGDRHVVVLTDEAHPGDPDRTLQIWIGAAEATALALLLDGAEVPRPGTHRLTAALLEAAGERVERVDVVGLVDGVFYARVALSGGASVDARPSDALTLAVLTGAPVRVEPDVLAAAATSPRRVPPGPSDHAAIAADALAEAAAQRRP